MHGEDCNQATVVCSQSPSCAVLWEFMSVQCSALHANSFSHLRPAEWNHGSPSDPLWKYEGKPSLCENSRLIHVSIQMTVMCQLSFRRQALLTTPSFVSMEKESATWTSLRCRCCYSLCSVTILTWKCNSLPLCSAPQACVLHYLRDDSFKFLVIYCIESAINKEIDAEYVSILSNTFHHLDWSAAL